MNNSSENKTILAPLQVADPSLAARIAEGLLALGYTGDAMRAAVPESSEATTSIKMDHGKIAERLGMETPLACLLRAFLLHTATPEGVMKASVGEAFYSLCDEAGLWLRVEGGVVGSVVFLEDEQLFLLSDHTSRRMSDIAMYWVMNIGTSTVIVAESIARRKRGRVLDLCCGGGIQSFYLSRYAETVVGIDRNPRALNYGRFGASMSGYSNIEFRESDCYSAVAGEKFDLIVCNPPYVMTPDRQAYYRDGGMGGDRFSERVLREAPEYMTEGGFTHMVCDVAAMAGKTSEERLREWLSGNGCDVVALAGKAMEPAEYVKSWLKLETVAAASAEAERWLEYFQELGVAEIKNWLVVMRLRSHGAGNWFAAEKLSSARNGHFGHQIDRMFWCEDVLRESAEKMWTTKLRLAPDVRLRHTVRVVNGAWVGEEAQLTFSDGLLQEFMVDPRTANLLLLFDGKRSSEDVLRRVAAELGEKREEMREGWTGYVRHLIGGGILEPVLA